MDNVIHVCKVKKKRLYVSINVYRCGQNMEKNCFIRDSRMSA